MHGTELEKISTKHIYFTVTVRSMIRDSAICSLLINIPVAYIQKHNCSPVLSGGKNKIEKEQNQNVKPENKWHKMKRNEKLTQEVDQHTDHKNEGMLKVLSPQV